MNVCKINKMETKIKSYIDDEYVRKRFGENIPQEYLGNVKGVIQKYGDNHWYTLDNPLEVAMYQVFEDILVVPISKFHEGLEELLGRSVSIHELGIQRDRLEKIRNEARKAIQRLKNETSIGDEERTEAIDNGMQMAVDYCQETGTELLGAAYQSRKDKPVLN